MKRKSLTLVSLILLVFFSLTILDVASPPSTRLFVDPPEFRDDSKQAGSSFTVDINVSDVSDLYGWQVNMSWDPAIVNLATITEGEFLKGPFPWDSHPYHHATEPYSKQEETPGSSTTISAGWTPEGFPPPTLVQCVANPADKKQAYCSTDGAEEEWGDFGFDTASMSCVAALEVKVLCYTVEANSSEQDKIEIEVTNDSGTTWGPTHTLDVYESKINRTAVVTDDFSWTPSMLTNANFKVRMRYKQVGSTANTTYVDCFVVKAVDTLMVDSPDSAYDKVTDSYASFHYGETDGNFTVYDLSHDFPSGATNPAGEASTIAQVDFNMRYSTNASTASDKYRIAYYVDPSPTETVLLDWDSSTTPLDTYTWTNQTEPNGLGWNWYDVSNIRIVVKTDKVGGDSNAVFREYEAWVTVIYTRPTTLDKNTDHLAEGWCLFSVLTDIEFPGVSGSGSLASIEFDVLDYGETDLNITDPTRTWLKDSNLDFITVTPEDGYFSNVIPGDFDKDRDVDPSDFAVFAGAYGTSPPSNPACDFDGDNDVDPSDFAVFAGNYGRSV